MKRLVLGLAVLATQIMAEPNKAYVLDTTIWGKSIPVCWESFNESTATERAWVRTAVEGSWEEVSGLDFSGWSQCNGGSTGIRIAAIDAGPHTKGLGTQLNGVSDGMVLNFTFDNWGTTAKSNREYYSKVIAIHEFGHALGFAHEQNRDDTPDTCNDQPQGSNGNVKIGDWDINSVMNYCNPTYSGAGNLSTVDIQAVRQYYGTGEEANQPLIGFDAKYYRHNYADLENAFGNNMNSLLNHWIKHGQKEGRRASLEFDSRYYADNNPDLKNAYGYNYVALVNHWENFGTREGRRASVEFDSKFYVNYYPDLKHAFGTDYVAALNHWVAYGKKEGRKGSAGN